MLTPLLTFRSPLDVVCSTPPRARPALSSRTPALSPPPDPTAGPTCAARSPAETSVLQQTRITFHSAKDSKILSENFKKKVAVKERLLRKRGVYHHEQI